MGRSSKNQMARAIDCFKSVGEADLRRLADLCAGHALFTVQRLRRSRRKAQGWGREMWTYQHPLFRFTTVDEALIQYVSALTQEKYIGPCWSLQKHQQPRYWITFGGAKALRLGELLYPYLGKPQRIKIDTMRQAYESKWIQTTTQIKKDGRRNEVIP